jgi:hypothetical protein
VRSMAVVRTMCGDENWQQYRLQVVIMVWEKKISRCGGGYFLYRVGSLELGGYDESEYQPEPDSPPPSRRPKQPKPPAVKTPKTPQNPRPPKTPTSRVRSGRVEKSGASSLPAGCPVEGCGQTFKGGNPRQSLWHHLKYFATRVLPDRQEFEKLHGEAHAEMKREAGMPIQSYLVSLFMKLAFC